MICNKFLFCSFHSVHGSTLTLNTPDGRRKKASAFLSAKETLSASQGAMKRWYDHKVVVRCFKPGDQVLVLSSLPGTALTNRFLGPYVVERKVSDTDYIICTPERRRKTRLCHVNMLTPYFSRDSGPVQSDRSVESVSLVCV